MKVFFQIKFSITAKEETQIEEELVSCIHYTMNTLGRTEK